MSSIKALEKALRPREKAISKGLGSLSEAELIAIIIKTGGKKGNSALDGAQLLLSRFHSLSGLMEAPLVELLSVPGIGEAKGLAIMASFELARRAEKAKEASPPYSERSVRSYLGREIDSPEETLYLFHLDNKGRILSMSCPLRGLSRQEIGFGAGRLLSLVLRSGSPSFALVHNHPSGTAAPSKEDYLTVAALEHRSRGLGVEFFDAMIIAGESSFSFRAEGLLGKGDFAPFPTA